MADTRIMELGALAGRAEALTAPSRWQDIAYGFERAPMPAPQAELSFFTDTSICIGCKACEVACKQWNQLPADEVHWSASSYDNTFELSATSWRHVKFIERFPPAAAAPAIATPAGGFDLAALLAEPKAGEWLMLSDQCKHCAEAPCHKACPTGAIIQNEFGGIFIQPDVCTGCEACVSVCPFGVPQVSEIDGHSHKCTMCYDRLVDGLRPACATACPTEAISFGRRDEMLAKADARVTQLRARGHSKARLYGDRASASYSALNSFYLLLDQAAVYGLPEQPLDPWRHMRGDYLRGAASLAVGIAILAAAFSFGV